MGALIALGSMGVSSVAAVSTGISMVIVIVLAIMLYRARTKENYYIRQRLGNQNGQGGEPIYGNMVCPKCGAAMY